MELRQYLNIIWKWSWLVAVSVILAASASYIASRSATPLYSTKATLMVGRGMQNPNPNYYEMYTSQQLANTYIELAKREPVLQGAIDELGLDMDWRSLSARVSASVVAETQLFEISVVDSDPNRAKVLADAIAEQLILQSTTNIDPEQASFTQDQIDELELKIEAAQDEIEQLTGELDAANSARQIDSLQNQINLLENKITDWQTSYSQLLTILKGGDINTLSVVEQASIPTAPFSPRVFTNVLIAAAIGFMLAVAGAFLIEYLDDTVKSPETVERITRLPTLGGIARIEGDGYAEKLVTSTQPMLPISEAFRVLRTNLQFAFVDNPPRTISITSPGPSEGKSIIMANLAVVMAQSGRKVVVVDTDLRRPVQHKIFKLPNRHGLSDVIINPNGKVAEQLQGTKIENLFLLSSGSLPPNPAELLGSERMRMVIDELQGFMDVILFDSPPVLVVTDAAILGSKVDGVVLMCDVGRTRSAELKRAVEELQRGRANVIGVILNRISARASGYFYNYYYYYHYYGEDGDVRRGKKAGNGWGRKLPSLPFLSKRASQEQSSVHYGDEKV